MPILFAIISEKHCFDTTPPPPPKVKESNPLIQMNFDIICDSHCYNPHCYKFSILELIFLYIRVNVNILKHSYTSRYSGRKSDAKGSKLCVKQTELQVMRVCICWDKGLSSSFIRDIDRTTRCISGMYR